MPSAVLDPISILHKYDYNQDDLRAGDEGVQISILHKYDYNGFSRE